MAHPARRRLNPPKNNANASTVPPGDNQNKIPVRFSALDVPVVVTVSVEDWTPITLRETETGFKLQVGMSLTPVIVVVTLHVRFTVPLNPFVPTMLTIPVFPVVEPRVTVIDVVVPGSDVKPGGIV
jgi:hypothetical protein